MLSTKTAQTLAEIENQVLREKHENELQEYKEKMTKLEEENLNLKRELNNKKIQEIQFNQNVLKMNKTVISLKKKWETEIIKQKSILEEESKKEILAIKEDFLSKGEEMRQNYKRRAQELEELQENFKKDKEEQLGNLKKQLDLKDGTINTLKDQLKTIKSKISVFSNEYKKKFEKRISMAENEKRNLQKQFTQFSSIISQLADSPNGKGLRTRLENIEKQLKERLSIVQINQELAEIVIETKNCNSLLNETNNSKNNEIITTKSSHPSKKSVNSLLQTQKIKEKEQAVAAHSPGTTFLLEYFPDLLGEINQQKQMEHKIRISEPEFEFSDYTDNTPERNLEILKREIGDLKEKILQNHTFDIEI